MINEHLITGTVTLILGFFGKSFWDFWKNRDIIKGQIDTRKKLSDLEKVYREKISSLEDEIHALESQRDKTNTAVKMMLTIFEEKYGKDKTYTAVILQVKKILNQE